MSGAAPAGRLVFVAANPSVDCLYEVDRLEPGAIHRPAVVVTRPGGKGLNAARAAAALGARVTAVGIVGGPSGEWIIDGLTGLRIGVRMVRSAHETRRCVSILDRSTGEMTEFYETGGAIADGAWADLEDQVRLELASGDVGALAFSGSLPPGAPSDAYARLARLGLAAGVLVLADAYGPALDAVLPVGPSLVKVNAVEAGAAAGIAVTDAVSAARAARALRARGAASVIVTMGIDGAVVSTDGGEHLLEPPAARGRYAVGSGDAFLAGVAIALVSGAPVLEAARWGIAAGAANALVPGAGDLHPAVAAKLLAEVVAEPLGG